MSHVNAHCTYLVAIDAAKGTLTRYVHHRGTWGVRHLTTTAIENPDILAHLGEEPARKMLEEFRARGDVT